MCKKLVYLFSVLLLSLVLTSGANAALVRDTATGETPVSGTVTGTYTNTQSSDDVYESIQEVNDVDTSFLEHKWTFNVTGGETVVFNAEAYCTGYDEPGPNDAFLFAYSTNGTDYTDMFEVTKTADDDKYQGRILLPKGISGTLYIRVTDTDRTTGNLVLDTIYVDHMQVISGPNMVCSLDFDGDYLDTSDWANYGVPRGNAQIVNDDMRGLVLDVHAEDYNTEEWGYVDLVWGYGEPGSLIIQDTITLTAWIWVRSFSAHESPYLGVYPHEWEGIITKDHDFRLCRQGYGPDDYDLYFCANGLSVDTMFPDPATNVWDGEWKFVAGVYDPDFYGTNNGREIYYLNGVEDRAADCTGQFDHDTHMTVWIGGMSNSPNDFTSGFPRFFDGRIDEVRIFNAPLTAAEIWEMYIRGMVSAYSPYPAHKSTIAGDEKENLNLNWAPGSYADKHNVYFGTDPEALGQIGFLQSPNNITLAGPWATLDLDGKYYWKVDEVNTSHLDSPWPGPVWEFTVGNYLTVDDFVPYDGFYDNTGVGFEPSTVVWKPVGLIYTNLSGEYNETSQSMEIQYFNHFAPYYNGAKRTFSSAQDWSGVSDNVKALDLYVKGGASGAENAPMYVELTDTTTNKKKVMLSPDLTSAEWQALRIDLQDFAPVVLSDVNSIEIGVGTGSDPTVETDGIVYIDDIRLYVPRPKCDLDPELRPTYDFTGPEGVPDCAVDYFELAAIIEHWLAAAYVAPAGPVLCYELDGDFDDSSGFDEHGTRMPDDVNGPQFVVDPDKGTVLSFDGKDDYVALPYVPGDPCYVECVTEEAPLDPVDAITICAWVEPNSWGITGGSDRRVYEKGDMWQIRAVDTSTNLELDLSGYGPLGVDPTLTMPVPSLHRWHHIAGRWDGAEIAWYLDGTKVASAATTGDRLQKLTGDCPGYWFHSIGSRKAGAPVGDHFDGLMSDVCIYDYALSPQEIRGHMTGAPTDLLLHYKLDGNANDSSGHGVDGTVIGGAVFVADVGDANKPAGTVLSCDGTDDCIDITATPGIFEPYDAATTWAPLDPCEDMSITAWVKADAWGPGDRRVLEKYDQFRIRGQNSGADLQFDLEGWGPAGIVPGEINITAPSLGVWHHVAVTYDGAEVAAYVDGKEVARQEASGTIQNLSPDGTNSWYYCVGSKKAGAVAGDHFDGLMSDVRIYDYGLTAEEVDAVMCGGEAGLLLKYNLAGDADDSSGHGEDGSLYGGAVFTVDATKGTVLSLDGTDDCVDLSATPGIPKPYSASDTWAPYDPCEDMSITAWVKPDDWSAGDRRVLEKYDQFRIRAQNSGADLQFDLEGWGPAGIVPGEFNVKAPSLGKWSHVAVTYDGAEAAAWVNGRKVASAAASGTIQNLSPDGTASWYYCIGSKKAGATANDHFDGLMTDVRIYDYGLGEDGVRAVMTGAPTDLLLQYKLDGNANDSSGHGVDGTVIGGAVFVADVGDVNKPAGTVLSCDGTDDCIDISATPGIPLPYDFNDTWAPLDPCEDLTICAWVKPDAWGPGDRRVLEKYDQFRIRGQSSGAILQFDLEGWGPAGIVPGELNVTAPSLGKWHHIAVTYDGGEVAAYVDGREVARQAASGTIQNLSPDGTNSWYYCVGSKKAGAVAGDHFDGLMSDVRIYDYGLTQRQIWKVMNGYDLPAARSFPLTPDEDAVDLYDDDAINMKDIALIGAEWLSDPLWP